MNTTQKKHIINNLHVQENRMLKYFNRMQREAMMIRANQERYVCARGTGKSEGIDARFILQNVWAMPGSLGGLISPSYAKAWGNTLPAIIKGLAKWGYHQDVHFYVGRKAPESANFKKPHHAPQGSAWSNCIHFWNGTVLVVLSFTHSMSANSMSLDWVIGPEAKFLDYEKITAEVNPANRGNRDLFDYCPWHHSVLFSTDMPTSKRGKWILESEDKMIPGHINLIRTLYSKIQEYKQKEQTGHVQRQVRELNQDLNIARRYQPVKKYDPLTKKKREYTVFFAEYDILDNLEILGEDFIWQMKRDNPDLIWRTAFMNERLFKVANGFYSALNEDIHFYQPVDMTDYYDLSFSLDNCLGDSDLKVHEPLHVAFDSNAAISGACIGQRDGNKMRTLKSFFVKTPRKLPELCKDIAGYYAQKINRDIVFYFDHTFVWKNGKDDESYSDTIIRCLTEGGLRVTPVYIGQQPRHDWRHKEIDRALKGDPELLFPLFNLYNNEFLKIAMEQTGIRTGKNGFEKDKTPESTPDSPDAPDEHKTHITDAWDTLYVGMNYHYSEPGMYATDAVFLGK